MKTIHIRNVVYKFLLFVCICGLGGCASVPITYPDQAPTITFRCDGPCEATYTDPRDRMQPVRVTNGWDFGLGLVGMARDTALGIAPWAAVGIVAYESGKNMRGHGATTSTTVDSRVTTSTDNSVDYSGNRGRIGSSDDYTHTPLVVTQPAPLVVTQPAPFVVNPLVVSPVVVTP